VFQRLFSKLLEQRLKSLPENLVPSLTRDMSSLWLETSDIVNGFSMWPVQTSQQLSRDLSWMPCRSAAGIKASAAADSVLDAVVDFTKSKLASSLKTVKVVLLQQTMLNDFCESMKARDKTAPPQSEPVYHGQT
ncbi:hypothetical protein AB205_0034240, partial [Aquarana catesbeiana]